MNKANQLVPGTIFIDGVPETESGRTVRYIMAVYSPQIEDISYPVRIIAKSLSYSGDWTKYSIQDNDCTLSLLIGSKKFNNIKLCPINSLINFRQNSRTNIQFQSDGYYIISIYNDDEVTLLPLTTMSDVSYIDGYLFFRNDLKVENAKNSFKEMSDIIDDVLHEIPYYVKMDDNGNASIPGTFTASNFVSGNVNLLDVASSLSSLIQSYNSHIEDYNELVTLVSTIRTTVANILSEMVNFVKKNSDGSITVTDVKFNTTNGIISVLDVCNTVSTTVSTVNTLVQSLEQLKSEYNQTVSDLENIAQTVTVNSNDITNLTDKFNSLKDVVSQLQNILEIDFSKFVQYDAEDNVSAEDYKLNAEGITFYSGKSSTIIYRDEESIYKMLNDIVVRLNTIGHFMDDRDWDSIVNNVASLVLWKGEISAKMPSIEAHITNQDLHITNAERQFINKLMNPDTMYVVRDL